MAHQLQRRALPRRGGTREGGAGLSRGRQRRSAGPRAGWRRRGPDRRAAPASIGAGRGALPTRSAPSIERWRGCARRDRAPYVLRLRPHRPRPACRATRSCASSNECAATHVSLEAAQPELDPEVLRDLPVEDDRARRPRPGLGRGRDRRSVVAERIRRALTVLPPERLVVAPGLRHEVPRRAGWRSASWRR